MLLTPAQITILKNELQNDPRGYGYNALARNDTDMANNINTVRDGTNVPSVPTADGGSANGKITLNRPDCLPTEILEAIDIRDLIASPPGVTSVPFTQSWFESVAQSTKIRLANNDGTKTIVRKNIDRMTGDTQGSQTRLDAVAVRNGSRAEEKFGFGASITIDNIGQALN